MPGAEEPRTPRRRLRDRWVLLTALALVAVLVVGGAGTVWVLERRLTSGLEHIEDPFEALPTRPAPATPEDDPATEEDESAGTPVTFLVLGTDSRTSAGDPTQWVAGGQRTDVILLVHLAADGRAAQVVSIPRDSWVDIPGHGEAKINAAYSYGGPTLLIQTVEQLTGVRVDHFAVTDFESFAELTDALGGVRLTLGEDLVDRGRLVAPAGEQVLSGEEALVYVRQRKNLARGDFDRVQRHQAWMRAILEQVWTSGTLNSPSRAYSFLETVARSVAVDDGLTTPAMFDLAMRARSLRPGDVDFLTVPIDGIGASDDGQSIVLLDRPAFDDLMAAVREDTVDEYLAAEGDEVDRLPEVAP